MSMHLILPFGIAGVSKLALLRAVTDLIARRRESLTRSRLAPSMTVFGKPIAIDRVRGEASIAGLTLVQAEHVLDWLETRAGSHGEVEVESDLFVVRWRLPHFRRRETR
jgi:hypothetical protein